MITGAAGHIGSHLIRSLPKELNVEEIILIDNMTSNRYTSFFDLPNTTKYKYLEENLATCDINSLPKTDFVVHLAAKTDAAQSANFEEEFYSNNLEATKNLISYCNKNESKLIFASTTSVYGPQSNLVDEHCSKEDLNPQSPYADVKLLEEKIISESIDESQYLILRFGTIFGFARGIRFHTAVNKFCFQASTGTPLSVWTTAYEQVRPYLGLDDLNNALVHIFKHNLIKNDIYNIVSKNLTVKDIIECIKFYRPDTEIEYVDHEIMNQLSYEVSNAKFENTGYTFNSSVSENIKETLSRLGELN